MTKTYFISGHLDLTTEEFEKYYISKIDEALKNNSKFVIGNANGADLMAQKYIVSKGFADNITIYHRSQDNFNLNGLKTITGFKRHPEKDEAMTSNSDEDILWIRPMTNEYKEKMKQELKEKYDPNRISGTEQNLLRRLKIKK